MRQPHPRADSARPPAPRHTLTITAARPPRPDPGELSRFARRELVDLCTLYNLRPGCLLRVLIECFLDVATEDPAQLVELVDAARLVESGAAVPGCWLQEQDHEGEAWEPSQDAALKRRALRAAFLG